MIVALIALVVLCIWSIVELFMRLRSNDKPKRSMKEIRFLGFLWKSEVEYEDNTKNKTTDTGMSDVDKA